MKKTGIKILCLIMAFSFICSHMVFAEEVPLNINLNATSQGKIGDEAVIMIDAIINPGLQIQGVQVDFDFSENFPELKSAEIIKNTTGWSNTGITKHNLLAIGDIITEKVQLVAKITFDIPDDAAPGTEYVLTLSKSIAANDSQEFPAKLNKDVVKIIVEGGKLPESEEKPETQPTPKPEPKPEIPDNDVVVKDPEKPAEETAPWKNPFSDVKEKDWFFDSVRYVYEKELMSGVSMDEFAPNSTLTRGMLVTILYRFDGSPSSLTYGYSDVPRNMWYTKSVDWAASSGIVNGVGDGMFAPESSVTREQMAVIFYNYTKHKEINLEAKKDLSSFTDNKEISTWATAALEWAVATGIISGKDGNRLDPLGNATRAETAAIINRYAEKVFKK